MLESWKLRYNGQVFDAILLKWDMGHRVILRLVDSIGPFEADSVVILNLNTMDMYLYEREVA